MARKTKAPAVPTARVTSEIRDVMAEIAATVISDYFFDPEREEDYRATLAHAKAAGKAPFQLDIDPDSADIDAGACYLTLLGLKDLGSFRLCILGPDFEIASDGVWSFDTGEFSPAKVAIAEGTARALLSGLDQLADTLLMAESLDELAALKDMFEEEGDDDLLPQSQGAPAEQAVLARIAKRIAATRDPMLTLEERELLDASPHLLPVTLETFIEEAAKPGMSSDAPLLIAWACIFFAQLELLRFRLEGGYHWAGKLLREAQERILTAAEQAEVPAESWMLLIKSLTDARVPISASMQERLAEAGGMLNGDTLSSEDLLGSVREMLDTLASMSESPFDIVDSVQGNSAITPPNVRCFVATELMGSENAMLADAVPLLLFDLDASVRRHVALTLDQATKARALSATSLRRLIGLRNWLPPRERAAIDSTIRTARIGGMEPDAWPRTPDKVEVLASLVDGAAGQSVILIDRSERKMTIAGVLIRHGVGVVDAWIQPGLSRRESSELLEVVRQDIGAKRVGTSFGDRIVQHALAVGLRDEMVPPASLLRVAEAFGISTWQDRHIDLAAEVETEFGQLPPKDRTTAGLAALHARALQAMDRIAIFASWFEAGTDIEKRYAKMPAKQAVTELLKRELQEKRRDWAERFLFTALRCKASQDPLECDVAAPLFAVARALTGDEPLSGIPAMQRIAKATVEALPHGKLPY
ncbi:MAG TPA: hypothetical protein VHB27_10660 [Rhodopila sp.]|uniref:hypothetical protein n=1 Tax=Rhodopila sp. TaxID=2480087 RepID=UPI002C0E37C2|nr:hypothetical protein [Rhodopila sp.]HVY15684.1 hypothetical protein [Rhodopila sp.]